MIAQPTSSSSGRLNGRPVLRWMIVMVLARQHPGGAGRLAVVGGIVAAAAVVGVAFLLAGRLAALIPEALLQFVTRVFGLLLSAIAVQLIVDAVRTLARE